MEIYKIVKKDTNFEAQAAYLLRNAFPQAYSESAEAEVVNCLGAERVLLAAMEKDELLGFIGAIPQYGVTGWELHPLVVRVGRRGLGIGRKLCLALEDELRRRGAVTIYLGTDDEDFQTSLAGIDLYANTYEKIENIINYKNHPYEFYQKLGYKIVGVLPDANGVGKPDIWMAKRI